MGCKLCYYLGLQKSWVQMEHADSCQGGILSVCGQRQLAHRARCMSWYVGKRAVQRAAQLSCTVSGRKKRHSSPWRSVISATAAVHHSQQHWNTGKRHGASQAVRRSIELPPAKGSLGRG